MHYIILRAAKIHKYKKLYKSLEFIEKRTSAFKSDIQEFTHRFVCATLGANLDQNDRSKEPLFETSFDFRDLSIKVKLSRLYNFVRIYIIMYLNI